MTHPFKVSAKVVCVDDSMRPNTHSPLLLSKGVVYVVRSISFAPVSKKPCCSVVGISRIRVTKLPSTKGFYADRFRKLDDIKEENRMKESRAEGILHHRRKLQPIVLRDDTTTHQDKVNAARDHGLLRLLAAMDCGMKTFKGGIRNE